MGDVLFPRVVQRVTAPLYVAPVFADNTWGTIIKACQQNKVPDTWAVGAQKVMSINGSGYTIGIIGKNHDAYADGSGLAPLTFQLHYLYDTEYAMESDGSNTVGWWDCDMRLTHLPALLSLMPVEVQAGIREVAKKTSWGGQSSTIRETVDKLFLLSEVEVFGAHDMSFEGEGSRYAYYTSADRRKKSHRGKSEAAPWLERSPCELNSIRYCCVSASGTSDGAGAEVKRAIAPAFCF